MAYINTRNARWIRGLVGVLVGFQMLFAAAAANRAANVFAVPNAATEGSVGAEPPASGGTSTARVSSRQASGTRAFDKAEPNPWKIEAGEAVLPAIPWFPAPGFETVTFRQTYEQPPLVFVLGSSGGSDPMAVRIRNVTTSGFEAIQVEPTPNDGKHPETVMHYIAVEPGVHTLPSGERLIAGTIETSGVVPQFVWVTVDFGEPFGSPPAFLSQIQTMHNETATLPGNPSTPWLTLVSRYVDKHSAELLMERSETGSGPVELPETIAYLALSSGLREQLINNYGASVTLETQVFGDDSGEYGVRGWDNDGTAVSFQMEYDDPPLVVASKQTRVDLDGGWMRLIAHDKEGVTLCVDEDTAADAERSHSAESAGLVVFSRAFDAVVGGPTVAFASPSFSVDELPGSASITMALSTASAQPVSVEVGTSAGTATAGADYVELTETVTWDPGEDGERTVDIDIIGDDLVEYDETVNISLSNLTGGVTYGFPPQAVLTIVDNDDLVVRFPEVNYAEIESAVEAVVTVALSASPPAPVGVDVVTSPITATPGVDYDDIVVRLEWPTGDVNPRTISVPLHDDALLEGCEEVKVELSNPSGLLQVGPFPEVDLLLRDDESLTQGGWRLEADSVVVAEGGGWVQFRNQYANPPLVFLINAEPTSGGLVPPIIPLVLNVAQDGFQITADYYVQLFAAPTIWVNYLAIEPGTHFLPDGTRMEAGSVATAAVQHNFDPDDDKYTTGWETVTFSDDFAAVPSMLAQLQTAVNDAWLTVAVNSLSVGGAELALERSEVKRGTVSAQETIAYLAIDSGNASIPLVTGETVGLQARLSGPEVVEECNQALFFDGSLLALASLSSRIDSDGGWARLCQDVGDPASWSVLVEEDTFKDPEQGHYAPEHVSLVVFDASFDTVVVPIPELSIDDVSIAEDGGSAVLTVTMTGQIQAEVWVDYETVDGTAHQPGDYTLTSGRLTWDAGDTAPQEILVPIGNDIIDEHDETFTVELTDVSSTAVIADGSDSATVTIVDDDPQPTVGLTLATVPDTDPPQIPEDGGGTATVTATLSGETYLNVTVGLAFSGGALLGFDFELSEPAITIPSGLLSGTVDITAIDDASEPLDEDNETVGIAVDPLATANATPAGAPVTVTIMDDDPKPEVSLACSPCSPTGIGENGGVATVTASLTAVSGRDVAVGLTVVPGDASSEDYTLSGAPITILAGQMAAEAHITAIPDQLDENDETVGVAIDEANTPNATPAGGPVTVAITDDPADGPPEVRFSVASYQHSEGDSGTSEAAIVVTLLGESGKVTSVDFSTADESAEAGVDYLAVTGHQLEWSPGETGDRFLSVTIYADAFDEDDETVSLILNNASNVTIASEGGLATLTILDDDEATVSLQISPTALEEGGTHDTTVTALLAGDSPSGDVMVTLGFAGTAIGGGNDYTATDTAIPIPFGGSSGAIDITVVDDTRDEATETIEVFMAGVSGCTPADPQSVTAEITDDDNAAATVGFAEASYTVSEMGGDAAFVVTLSDRSGQEVRVDYQTLDGDATAGDDFTETSGNLVIAPGYLEHMIAVPITDDGTSDDDESFEIVLSNPQNATLGAASTTVTIREAVGVHLSKAAYPMREGQDAAKWAISQLDVDVRLTAPAPAGGVSVVLQTADGTAVGHSNTCQYGADYVSKSETLSFAAGSTAQTTQVTVCWHDDGEDPESFFIELDSPSGAAFLATPSFAEVTIYDDQRVHAFDLHPVHVEPDLVHIEWQKTSPAWIELSRRDADAAGVPWEPLFERKKFVWWRDFVPVSGVRYEYRVEAYPNATISVPDDEEIWTMEAPVPSPSGQAANTVYPGFAAVVAETEQLPDFAHPFAGKHTYRFQLLPDPGPDFEVDTTVDVWVDGVPADKDPSEPEQPWESPYDGLARDDLECTGADDGEQVVENAPCSGPTCDIDVPGLEPGTHRFLFVVTDPGGGTSERAIVQDVHPWWPVNAENTTEYPQPFVYLFSDWVNTANPELSVQGPYALLDSLDCCDTVEIGSYDLSFVADDDAINGSVSYNAMDDAGFARWSSSNWENGEVYDPSSDFQSGYARTLGRSILTRGSASVSLGGQQSLRSALEGFSNPRTYPVGVEVDTSLVVGGPPQVDWVTPALVEENSAPVVWRTVWLRVVDHDQDVDPRSVTVTNTTYDLGQPVQAYYADPSQQARPDRNYGWFVCRLPLEVGDNQLTIHVEDFASNVVDDTDRTITRYNPISGTYPVPVISSPLAGWYYPGGATDTRTAAMDATASIIPTGQTYEVWFAALVQDGSDDMPVVEEFSALSGAFTASGAVDSYLVRLVIAASGRMPSLADRRKQAPPCVQGDPDLECASAEVTIHRADSTVIEPFELGFALPETVLIRWGTLARPWPLERSQDGGVTWEERPRETDYHLRDTEIVPGTTYHYRTRRGELYPWCYLGGTTAAPGLAAVVPEWTAPRVIPTVDSVEWNCPEGATRFQCWGSATVTLSPEHAGESFAGHTVGVYINEDTFEQWDGREEEYDLPIAWPDSCAVVGGFCGALSGRDESGCVTRRPGPPDVEGAPLPGEDTVTIELENLPDGLPYGASSLRFVVDDGAGSISERALLVGFHEANEMGDWDVHHEPFLPVLFGTQLYEYPPVIRGLGPVSRRSPDCLDGDASYYYSDQGHGEVYISELHWHPHGGGYPKTVLGTDDYGAWVAELTGLSDGGEFDLWIDHILYDGKHRGHIGRYILDYDGSTVLSTDSQQQVSGRQDSWDYTTLTWDNTVPSGHVPVLDWVPSEVLIDSPDPVAPGSLRIRITDLLHDVDLSSIRVENTTLNPVQTAYGFYAADQIDPLGDWGWIVADVPLDIEGNGNNTLLICARDDAGGALGSLGSDQTCVERTVTRTSPKVFAVITEPDPPDVSHPKARGEIVHIDGSDSILPLDDFEDGVAQWAIAWYNTAADWYEFQRSPLAPESDLSGLDTSFTMPVGQYTALKARLVVAASEDDLPNDYWPDNGDLPCTRTEGDGSCDSMEVRLPPTCTVPLTWANLVVDQPTGSSISVGAGEEFTLEAHVEQTSEIFAFRWLVTSVDDPYFKWPFGSLGDDDGEGFSPQSDSLTTSAAAEGLKPGTYFILPEARSPASGCESPGWFYGKGGRITLRVWHTIEGVAPGRMVEGSTFRIYSESLVPGETAVVFLDDDSGSPLTLDVPVQDGGLVEVTPFPGFMPASDSAWWVSVAGDDEGLGRSYEIAVRVVDAGYLEQPNVVATEEDESCGGPGTECAHAITPGQTWQGSWGEPGDRDYFFFIAGSGTVVRVDLQKLGTGMDPHNPSEPDPQIIMVDATGIATAEDVGKNVGGDNTNDWIEWVVPSSGSQQIVVTTEKGQGDYLISLETVSERDPTQFELASASRSFTHLAFAGGTGLNVVAFESLLFDPSGWPVAGAEVTWEVVGDSGALTDVSAGPTYQDGLARMTGTLAPLASVEVTPEFNYAGANAKARDGVLASTGPARRGPVICVLNMDGNAVVEDHHVDPAEVRAIWDRRSPDEPESRGSATTKTDWVCAEPLTQQAVSIALPPGTEALEELMIRVLDDDGGQPGNEITNLEDLRVDEDMPLWVSVGGRFTPTGGGDPVLVEFLEGVPIGMQVFGAAHGTLEIPSGACDRIAALSETQPQPVVYRAGEQAVLARVVPDDPAGPFEYATTEVLRANVTGPVEVPAGGGGTAVIRTAESVMIPVQPEPSDPCEARFIPSDSVEIAGFGPRTYTTSQRQRVAEMILLDEFGNLVPGWSDNEPWDPGYDEFDRLRTWHVAPTSTVRVNAPGPWQDPDVTPPQGQESVWAGALTQDGWRFGIYLFGNYPLAIPVDLQPPSEGVGVPDGTYSVDVEFQTTCATSTGQLTVDFGNRRAVLEMRVDPLRWDFVGYQATPRARPGTRMDNALQGDLLMWRVQPTVAGEFRDMRTARWGPGEDHPAVPVDVYVARREFDAQSGWLFSPVDDVEICVGTAVKEPVGSESRIRAYCSQTHQAQAHLPSTYTEPTGAWAQAFSGSLGDAVGVSRTPERPGRYFLVAEQHEPGVPVGFDFGRNGTWQLDNENHQHGDRNPWVEFVVEGGLYLDEQYRPYGDVVDVALPHGIYVELTIETGQAAPPTIPVDIVSTDGADNTIATELQVQLARLQTGADGFSTYQSATNGVQLHPVGVTPEPGYDHDIPVESGGQLTTLLEGRTLVTARIDSGSRPVDVDVDSDNDEGISVPRRELTDEDDWENHPARPGKFVFVNHNDDDRDGVPDFADYDNDEEGTLVPMVLELNPGVSWDQVTVRIAYDGLDTFHEGAPQDLPDPRNGQPTGLFDYTDARRVDAGGGIILTPALRLWNVTDPTVPRALEDYVMPDQNYSAAELGFGDAVSERVFYLEGLNTSMQGGAPSAIPITVVADIAGTEYSDEVLVTVVEANLGVNNSSNRPGLRPGVPDADFIIDEFDEMVEDQGEGFVFWRGDFNWLSLGCLVEDEVESVFPAVVRIPAGLDGQGFSVSLRLESEYSDGLIVYYNPSPDNDLTRYLSDLDTFLQLVDSEGCSTRNIYDRELEIELGGAQTNLLLWAMDRDLPLVDAPEENRIRLHLVLHDGSVGSSGVSVDTVVLTIREIRNLFWMGSARGQPEGVYAYLTEPHNDGTPGLVQQNIAIYPQFSRDPDSGLQEPDRTKENYTVFLHGYNVPIESAYSTAEYLYRRLYWAGYRGNFVSLTWDGDEDDPFGEGAPALFYPNVENALQTSPRLFEFLTDTLQGQWGAAPTNTYLLAHSLGNLVMLDALRINSVSGGPSPLVRHAISVQAAVWSDTFWDQAAVQYPSGRTYTVEQLRRSAWTFWFNQDGQTVAGSAERLVNSYAQDDGALQEMRRNDTWLRTDAWPPLSMLHDNYPHCMDAAELPTQQRVPIEDGLPTADILNRPDLAIEIPALVDHHLVQDCSDFTRWDLVSPLGQIPSPLAGAQSVNAVDSGWGVTMHSDFIELSLPEIWDWYDFLFVERFPQFPDTILPREEE